MLLAGLVIGLLLGALLSLQLLWTDSPCILPLHTLCDLALKINSCNMDSVDAIHEMLELNSDPRGTITIINTESDNIIYPNASLCTGMRFPLEDEEEVLISDAQCEWRKGEHHSIGKLLKRSNFS
jgi:hypothetical protein